MTSFGMESASPTKRFNLHRTLIVSLLLHALVLSLVLSSSLPKPKWTFGPIYSVELVSLADSTPIPTRSSLSHEFTESSLPSHTATVRKRVEPMASPIRRIETPRKSIEGMDKVLDKIRHRSSAAPAVPHIANDLIPKSVSSSRESAELVTMMNAYYALIWSRIKGQWALPAALVSKENIKAVIDVRISRTGTVTDLTFEKRSGNRYFDESAMKAIKKASPLPPLPEGITDSSIEVGIRFHSAELR